MTRSDHKESSKVDVGFPQSPKSDAVLRVWGSDGPQVVLGGLSGCGAHPFASSSAAHVNGRAPRTLMHTRNEGRVSFTFYPRAAWVRLNR